MTKITFNTDSFTLLCYLSELYHKQGKMCVETAVKGEGKRFLHGDLICTYTLSEYISDIYVDGLCIISVKLNFETRRDSVRHYLFTAT